MVEIEETPQFLSLIVRWRCSSSFQQLLILLIQLVFPDLNAPPFGGEDFQTNLIMPEPTVFLSSDLPACSIVRPTNTKGVAMGALQFLTASNLFLGQSTEFFALLCDLAEDADDARRDSE